MKKSLMLVLVLLCMASLVAGMAYTSASLETKSNITLSAAENGMLAFTERADVEDPDQLFKIEDNQVTFNLSAGDKEQFGIQKHARYGWEEMFLVKNNTAEPIQVHVNPAVEDALSALDDMGVKFTLTAEVYEGDKVVRDAILIDRNHYYEVDRSYLKLDGMQAARVSIEINAKDAEIDMEGTDLYEHFDFNIDFLAGDWSEGKTFKYEQ